jgi:uncharacterized membrane protein YbhN (UPF0104 family)
VRFSGVKFASRRGLVAAALFAGVVAAVATAPRVVGARVDEAIDRLGQAEPAWLWLAALCFVSALLASAQAWRTALRLCGGRLSRADAAARYGIGSLVNSLAPVRVGEAARVALFAQALEGEDRAWRMGGVFATITVTRSLVFAVVLGAAAATGAVPLWPLVAICGLVAVAATAVVVARRRVPRRHVAHLLDAFRELGRSPVRAARIVGWSVVGTVTRFVAAVSIAASLDVRSPVTAALIVVPALDLAGLIPLSANFGVTSGTVAVALQAHGVGLGTAVTAGLAFHAVETAAGLIFGVASALLLAGEGGGVARRRSLVLAGATACACIAAAFWASVVLPLI